ncbi:GNAT family N-acetyltransferase [Corynebacterium gerontici]|uniref:Ribosomal N-acetyltransferase YdaF n=1 Tax=Corynebacterium gerontici TaxID=2079234 RepID=A0A3G6IZ14_9CORY|nr:GNAT family protein [Corynebacterium gerontici]AZA11031.1 Putative ribosomal N-acetyltransferase YdaF [Corynebacterium gerontici]
MIDWLQRWLKPTMRPATGPRDPRHPGWCEYTKEIVVPRMVANQATQTKVRLRPLLFEDSREWSRLRLRDQIHLEPVEPTLPGTWESAHDDAGWKRYFYSLQEAAREGNAIPFAIIADGSFVGQITIDEIRGMPWCDATLGYWVDRDYWGRGIASAACALAIDHAFERVGLHRLTATFMPDNPASGKVLARNGFQEEGLLRGNMHINGRFEDHFFMGLNRDDFTRTAVQRLLGKQSHHR